MSGLALVVGELGSEGGFVGKALFVAQPMAEGHLKAVAIEAGVEFEDVGLYGGIGAAESGAASHIGHGGEPCAGIVDAHAGGIDATGRQHLGDVGHVEIGGAEPHAPAFGISAYDGGSERVGVTQCLSGAVDIALGETSPYERRAHPHALMLERRASHHVDVQLSAVGYVVVEPLGTVVSEAVVVAGDEFSRVDLLA